MNINLKYRGVLIALFASSGMSCFMSLTMLLFNLGVVDDFFQTWLKAWGLGFLVGFPAATMLVPLAQKAAIYLTLPEV